MMRRRARPSARTTRTAPTAPCVPVGRVGAPVPRSVPPDAGPVTGNGSCTSVEGGSERSTGSPGETPGRTSPSTDPPAAGISRRAAVVTGLALVAAALAIYLVTYDRPLLRPLRVAGGRLPRGAGGDPLSRSTARRRPARQRLLPGRAARSRRATACRAACCRSRRCRPSSCCRSWRSGAWPPTTSCCSRSWPRSTSGSCWWMLGRLPVGPAVRLATTVFFAFGTVFWYTAQLVDDLVPGPRRGGRPHDARDRARARRGPRRRGDEPDAVDGPDARAAGRRARGPPRRRRLPPIDRAPARGRAPVRAGLHGPDCRSSSGRRSSRFVGRGAGWRGGGPGRPALGAAIPVGPCSPTTWSRPAS